MTSVSIVSRSFNAAWGLITAGGCICEEDEDEDGD